MCRRTRRSRASSIWRRWTGHGAQSTGEEFAADARLTGASALALVQGIADADVTPTNGVWLITRGAQVLERERGGQLAGALLWGVGKVIRHEAGHLQPRMIDLDPSAPPQPADLVNDLLYPDEENHIAYRLGRRRAARLVRSEVEDRRLALPAESSWVLAPDPDGMFDRPQVKPLPTA